MIRGFLFTLSSLPAPPTLEPAYNRVNPAYLSLALFLSARRILLSSLPAFPSKVTIGAVQACVDDVEYALRLMQKAAVARQARVSVQTPEGLRSFLRAGGGDSQSSGTVSEARSS